MAPYRRVVRPFKQQTEEEEENDDGDRSVREHFVGRRNKNNFLSRYKWDEETEYIRA